MEIGVSLACFYPMEPENAAKLFAGSGVRVCEVFLNTMSELDENYLLSLRKECDDAGLKVYSVHPFTSFLENYMFFSPYPRRIADAVALYRLYARAAKILGAGVVNIHGDRGIGLEDFEAYVDCLRPLMELQKETGIIFALENVFFNSVDHPEFVSRLRNAVPEARFTFDIKQAFKGGQDAYLLAEAMGEAIVNFHVNDRDEDHVCLLPGEGSIDYGRIAAILRKNGYNGPALIEVYSKNFETLSDILNSKVFLENKFALAN